MKIPIRDFVPPILIGLLKKIRKLVFPSTFNEEKVKIKEYVIPYICPSMGSFSQFNEDLLIDLLFDSKRKGFYVDIGANDPAFNNNTKRFYDKGWHGINIEPSIEEYEKLQSSRLRDINLNIGVGLIKNKMSFYKVLGDSTLSSFNKTIAIQMAKFYGLQVLEEEIQILRLVDIYNDYIKDNHVDFMSVDAEGSDLDVLKSNDWKIFRPTLVMVEADSQYNEIVEYMSISNYLLLYNNNHNAIFLSRDTTETKLKTIVMEYFYP